MAPATMWAIAQTKGGDSSVLQVLRLPKPTPEGRDILIKNHAVAINPVDVKVREQPEIGGGTSDKSPKVVGWDAAGIVEAVGNAVTAFKVGDEVWYAGARHRNGSNSEFTLVDERIVGKKPKSLSFADAAALPLTTLTAWEALFHQLSLPLAPIAGPSPNSDVTLLIINAAGGVGSIATQLASNVFRVGVVVGTASRPESEKFVRTNGADHILNHRHSLAAQVQSLNLGVTHVLICHDPDAYWSDIVDLIRPFGKVASIRPPSKQWDWGKAFAKSVGFAVEFMFAKPQFALDLAPTQHSILTWAADLVDAGIIRTTATEYGVLSLESLRQAHDKQKSSTAVGKTVLTVPEGGLA